MQSITGPNVTISLDAILHQTQKIKSGGGLAAANVASAAAAVGGATTTTTIPMRKSNLRSPVGPPPPPPPPIAPSLHSLQQAACDDDDNDSNWDGSDDDNNDVHYAVPQIMPTIIEHCETRNSSNNETNVTENLSSSITTAAAPPIVVDVIRKTNKCDEVSVDADISARLKKVNFLNCPNVDDDDDDNDYDDTNNDKFYTPSITSSSNNSTKIQNESMTTTIPYKREKINYAKEFNNEKQFNKRMKDSNINVSKRRECFENLINAMSTNDEKIRHSFFLIDKS